MRTEWLSAEDIAEELNVKVSTVRSWIRNRKLKAVKLGRDYRIKREDYEKFLEERSNTFDEDMNDQED